MIRVIALEARTATVFREPTEGRLLCEDTRLSGEDVLPGFECRVAELFCGRLAPEQLSLFPNDNRGLNYP